MSKKAQGLSMNVIIIAAIALLVLVILAVLILRAGRGVTEGTGCEGIGGTCADACGDLDGLYVKNIPNSGRSGGCAEGESCCIPLMKSEE